MRDIAKYNIYGILWILANNLNMSIQSATIKSLSSDLGSSQIVFLYKLTVWLFILVWVCFTGFKQLKTQKIHLYFIRAFLSIAGALTFVKALKFVPLANATAIVYAEPLVMTLWAFLLLKEYLNSYCIIALVIGFCGTLIALHPGSDTFNSYSLLVLCAAIIWSLDNLVIKFLGRTQKSVQYLFYISLFSTLMSIPFAVSEWKPLLLWHFPWIMALAGFYFFHLIAVFKAYQFANLSVLAPFDFSRIIFSTGIGMVFFGEGIDRWGIIGSLIVACSSVYIIWHKEHLPVSNQAMQSKN